MFYAKTKLKSLATTGLRCMCGCHARAIRVLAERLLRGVRPQQPQWQSKHTSARRIMGNTRAGALRLSLSDYGDIIHRVITEKNNFLTKNTS